MSVWDTNAITLTIKWWGQPEPFKIHSETVNKTVFDLKNAIYMETGVKPEHQKLIGLKSNGKPVIDETSLAKLDNTNFKMIGSKEEDIASVDLSPEDIFQVVNDIVICNDVGLGNIPIQNREEFLAEVDKRVKKYKVKMLSEPRFGKKLLVLDIYQYVDYHLSSLLKKDPRPFLHKFLAIAYEEYDIVIWSATDMKSIEVKMRELGVERNPNYKILFYLDSGAMISVHAQKYGFVDVKPLGVIWGKFRRYEAKNTISFDYKYIRENFLMNRQNRLRIKAFGRIENIHEELSYLVNYLADMAEMRDFSTLNHRHWYRLIKTNDY